MEAMLGVRFLASEYPTGPWHRGRVDSLGLDEDGAPVIVEFKKGADSGVVSQALSYLSWLLSARYEFEALVRRRLGAEAADGIDWRNARLICVAAAFSHHDRVAVRRLPERVSLVRYRVFEGGLLSLQLVEASPGTPGFAADRRRSRDEREQDAVVRTTGQAGLEVAPACLRDLYGELDEALTAWGDVEVNVLRHYVAYRLLVNRASVVFRPKQGALLVYLALTPDAVALEEGFTRDMRGIGHLGTGDLEVRIASATDLEKAAPLIRRAFESV